MEKLTPKEKAEELVDSFNNLAKDFTRGVSMNEFSRQCALRSVDEILKAVESDWGFMEVRQDYWQQVKTEIERL
jgi:hypothetical protein